MRVRALHIRNIGYTQLRLQKVNTGTVQKTV